MAYSKTNWVNDSTPAISAANLNKIEQGILDNSNNLSDTNNKLSTVTTTDNDTLVDFTVLETKSGKSAFKNGTEVAFNDSTNMTAVKIQIPQGVTKLFYQGQCIGGNVLNPAIVFMDSSGNATSTADATESTSWIILSSPVEISIPSGSAYAYVNFRYMSTRVSIVKYHPFRIGNNNLTVSLKSKISTVDAITDSDTDYIVNPSVVATNSGKRGFDNSGTVYLGDSSSDTCVQYNVPSGSVKLVYQGQCVGGNVTNPAVVFTDSNGGVIATADATTSTSWVILDKPVEINVPSGSIYAYVNFRRMSERVSIAKFKTYPQRVYKNGLVTKIQNDLTNLEKFSTSTPKATILFAFDLANYDNRAEILEANGFRGTFNYTLEFPATSHAGFVKLIQHGHDIGIYRGGSIENEPDLVTGDWDTYIKTGLDWLSERGHYYLPTVYGCHSHKSSQAIIDACNKYNIPYISAVTKYTSASEYDIYYPEDNTPFRQIVSPWGMPTHTVAETKAAIDTCITNNSVLPLFTHLANVETTGDGNITEAYLEEIVAYVKTKYNNGLVDVLTYRQLYNKYHRDIGLDRDYNRTMAGMISNVVWN